MFKVTQVPAVLVVFLLAETLSGSTNKNSVTITADDKSNTNFFESALPLETPLSTVTSQARTWNDARNLNLQGDLKVEGLGGASISSTHG